MNKRIALIIAIIIIAIGVVVTFMWHFNKSLEFSDYTRIIVYMNKESNIEDVEQIVKDNYDGAYIVSFTDEFKDTISIQAKDISDEQIDNIKNSLKEKYEFEEDSSNITVINTPGIPTFDLIKDYIMPVAISFVIVIIYLWIAYRKEGIAKSLVEPCLTVVIINALYVAMLAICRVPINSYIIPIGVLIYVLSLIR